MIDKTRTFKRWTPGKSGGGKLSETKGECGVSLLTRQSETRREAYGRGSVGERGALWEQVAVSVRAARAVYRAPLSLSIFRGGKDYLVTDGPFAYPLDLWCIHARGCEPTQRSIDATRVSLFPPSSASVCLPFLLSFARTSTLSFADRRTRGLTRLSFSRFFAFTLSA